MRDAWLDRLRACAIAAVVVYHVVQMSPVPLAIAAFTRYGALGVDLFFALSGFLIGTLYWKERAQTGSVLLLRFWKRRWWRTLPAYYVALLLSWLATFMSRQQPFDVRYLFFLQNYAREIPFFLVSWSLCIEEHFYLFLPLLIRSLKLSMRWAFALLIGLPLILRAHAAADGLSPAFGYEQTATHLHMEGLVLGFGLSAAFVRSPALALRLQHVARLALAPLIAFACFSVAFTSEHAAYVLGSTAVALAMSALLVAGVGRIGVNADASDLSYRAVHGLALISYSVYLTHALVIHAARTLVARFGLGLFGYFVLAPCLIALVGVGFYTAVERPSLRLRERLVPR